MRFVSDYFGFPKHIEVCALIIIALIVAVADRSLLQVRANLQEVWALSLDPYRFPPLRQLFLKYVISSIVLVRTFTLHAHLACLVVMLWPAILEDHPSLLVPWLTVGSVRYLLADSVAMATGLYVCCAYGILNMKNAEYLLVQVIEHGPAFYMWACVYSFLGELTSYSNVLPKSASSTDLFERRRRAKFMLSNTQITFDDKADDGRNLISESTFVGLIHPLQRQLLLGQSRSIDALLGLKAAEKDQAEIMRSAVEYPTDQVAKSRVDLVMKTLGISFEDVLRARKERKSTLTFDVNLEHFIFESQIKRLSLSSSKSEGAIFKKTPFPSDPLNTATDSFTETRAVEAKPECTDMKSSGAELSESQSSREVEEIEQLLSEDLLSEDNYKILPTQDSICPKPSRVPSYLPIWQEPSVKETAVPTPVPAAKAPKATPKSPVGGSPDPPKQKVPTKRSYTNKYKASQEKSKKEAGTAKAADTFFRVDELAQSKSIETKRSRERRRASSTNEISKRSYADMKQKELLQNFINSVSSGSTSKFKGKDASKCAYVQKNYADHTKNLKCEGSCQVSTLSRKVLASVQNLLSKENIHLVQLGPEKALGTEDHAN